MVRSLGRYAQVGSLRALRISGQSTLGVQNLSSCLLSPSSESRRTRSCRPPTNILVASFAWLLLLAISGTCSVSPCSAGETQSAPLVPGYLGVYLQTHPAIPLPQGGDSSAVVSGVILGTPAHRAGLRVGDVIEATNATTIPDARSLIRQIRGLNAGEHVQLTIRRGEQSRSVAVTLGIREETPGVCLIQHDPPRVMGGAIRRGVIVGGDIRNSRNLITQRSTQVKGDFAQTRMGLVEFEVSGANRCTQLVTQGKIVLAGVLSLRVPNHHRLDAGQQYEILRGSAISGRFEHLMLPELREGLRWRIVYDDLNQTEGDMDHDGLASVTLLIETASGQGPP